MLGMKPQLQYKSEEDVSSFVTMWTGTFTYFKMENQMPGMNTTTWAMCGPCDNVRVPWVNEVIHLCLQLNKDIYKFDASKCVSDFNT